MVRAIVPHDPMWHEDFAHEAADLRRALPDVTLELHHIGSTAIPGILAKPIIDMLGAAQNICAIDRHAGKFEFLGYEAMGEYGIPGRRYFRKTDDQGRRSHHLHIYAEDAPDVMRHLAFRDYLNAHPETAQAYSNLKAALLSTDPITWERYLDGKDPFIKATEQLALDWYSSR